MPLIEAMHPYISDAPMRDRAQVVVNGIPAADRRTLRRLSLIAPPSMGFELTESNGLIFVKPRWLAERVIEFWSTGAYLSDLSFEDYLRVILAEIRHA